MSPAQSLRKLTAMTWGYLARGNGWGNSRWSAVLQPGSHFDYAREVGDPWRNSAAYVCLAWLARNIVKPELEVCRESGDDEEEEVDGHPLVKLLDRPNPYMSYADLWKATTLQFATGNAYWLKVRSRAGQVVELYPAPNWMMDPRSDDPSKLIGWYDYRAGSETIMLPPSEVVHFRNGVDPDNPMKGLSDFGYLAREMFTDNAVNTLIAATSKNMGITGLVVTPADGEQILPEDVESIRASLWQRTSGDNAGKPLVLRGGVKVDRIAWSLKEMELAQFRNGPSERICAALGLNTMAVNLPSDSKTYSNYAESLRAAYHDGLIPLADAFAETLYRQLLPDLGDPENERVRFEWDCVDALAEDQNVKADRVGKLYQQYQVLTRAEARVMLGLDAEEGRDDVFFAEAGPAKPGPTTTTTGDPASGMDPGSETPDPEAESEATDGEGEDPAAGVRRLDPFLRRREGRAG